MTLTSQFLNARHVLKSLGAGLAVFILFTSVIGIAVAQDDSPQDAPDTFASTRPAFGDNATYTLRGTYDTGPDTQDQGQHSEHEGGGGGQDTSSGDPVQTGDEEHAHASQHRAPFAPVDFHFQRTGELGAQRDADGVVHDVELIQWSIDSQSQDATSFPTGHILGTAVPVGQHDTWDESESWTYTSPFNPVIQSESYTLEHQGAYFQAVEPVPPCILRHTFQDTPVVLSGPVEAFPECSIPHLEILWDGTAMDVVGVETDDDGVALLHLRGTTPEMTMDAWFEPQVPYPVRIQAVTALEEVRMDLKDFNAGNEDALTFMDTPRDALPGLKDSGRHPWGLSDDGVAHPFPVSQAYMAAYDDPIDPSFKDWADANPDHTAVRTYFDEHSTINSEATPTSSWYLDLRGPQAEGALHVERREVQTADGDTTFLYEYEFQGHQDSTLDLVMPSTYPSLRDLADRWDAYLPESVNVQPTQFQYIEELDGWIVEAITFEDGAAPIYTGTGDYAYAGEHGRAVFDPDGALLYMEYMRFSTESDQQTLVDDAPPPANDPGADEPVEPTTLKARPDAPWVPPTPTQTAGAAGAAVLTGLLVYLWPALKGAPLFGLFSRLRRPELLGHPSRKKILDVIEADPGIHFQGLHRRTGLSNGNLVHHLRKLGQAGLVSEARSGGYTCYFAARDANRHTMQAAPVLRSDAARTMMDTIQERPGVNARQLADALGIGSSTVHYHLKRLQSVGLTRAERDGRTMTFFATDAARQTVDAA